MLWVWREPVREGRELGRGRSEKPKAKVREWVPASRKLWMGATAGHRGARAGGYVLHSLSSGLGPPVSASWVSRSQSQGILVMHLRGQAFGAQSQAGKSRTGIWKGRWRMPGTERMRRAVELWKDGVDNGDEVRR